MSVYLELTRQFNAGRLRAVLCSEQACVLHRLAIASKDGDWVLREDHEALDHVRRVLDDRGARYRFGAPLDVRWLAGGWSSHLEFADQSLRVRTDFFTRPPRLTDSDLAELWRAAATQPGMPYTTSRITALMKMTDRERDWAFVGELARLLDDPREELRFSRSARDLARLAARHSEFVVELARERPLLAEVARGVEHLEMLLDKERRAAMHANARRLETFTLAARAWAATWPELQREIGELSLAEAHTRMVERALVLLPTQPPAESAP